MKTTPRTKWTKKEDLELKKIIKKIKGKKCWDIISKKLSQKKIKKKSRQCRERWENQLNPKITKKDLDIVQKKKIFFLHKKKGSKWKEISEVFEKRTDNFIKNKFFSLFRKGLRKSLKILDKKFITFSVKKIKPKILSIFLRKDIFLEFKGKKISVDLNLFFLNFIFQDLEFLMRNCNEKDFFIIEKSFEMLQKLNNDYLEDKKKKKIRKNKKCQFNLDNFEKKFKILKVVKNKIDKSQNKKNFKSKKILDKEIFFENENKIILKELKIKNLLKNSNILEKIKILEKKQNELNFNHKIYLKLITKNTLKKEIFLKNISNMIKINKIIHKLVKNMNNENFSEIIIKNNF